MLLGLRSRDLLDEEKMQMTLILYGEKAMVWLSSRFGRGHGLAFVRVSLGSVLGMGMTKKGYRQVLGSNQRPS